MNIHIFFCMSVAKMDVIPYFVGAATGLQKMMVIIGEILLEFA